MQKVSHLGSSNQNKLEKSLFKAAAADDAEQIKELIEQKNININAQDTHKRTAVFIAVGCNSYNALAELLRHNPDINLPNKHGWTPLIKATFINDSKSVELLLNAGADVNKVDNEGYTPLMNAHSISQIAELLIAHGANIDHQAADDGRTALMVAANCGSLNRLQFLMRAGACCYFTDKSGNNALTIASAKNHQQCANFLRKAFNKCKLF